MNPQIPAEGILKRGEWGDSIAYQVACTCGSSDHDHNVWVESDDCNVTVSTYTTQTSKFWSFNRWKIIWTLLTKGYVKYEANIIMTEQQAINYTEALSKAIVDVKSARQLKVSMDKLRSSRR